MSDRSAPAPTNTGLGRVLILVYGIFALSATGRSTVQLLEKADEAPLAYGLSAFAAVVYIAATYCRARGPRGSPGSPSPSSWWAFWSSAP